MEENITYTINEVSERIGLTYRSLHYWEEKFELQINRDQAGNRLYTESDIETIEKIKELKGKGMTLDGIKALFQEKGLLPKNNAASLIVVDEKALELKEYLVNELREIVYQELQQQINEVDKKMDEIMKQNEELKNSNKTLQDEISKLAKQQESHYLKIDQQLTAWRNKKPWYQTIFNKSENHQ